MSWEAKAWRRTLSLKAAFGPPRDAWVATGAAFEAIGVSVTGSRLSTKPLVGQQQAAHSRSFLIWTCTAIAAKDLRGSTRQVLIS
ncbi:hypothetical protein PISMIDRAFT_125761 [Pisolithus microcarpus 441]|uniref:Uncharacterized protein n=1 Tax=Pisolithus microcarpus 441 TaxID=765257 RepID=A0A0D0AFL2_9AGAM|nr:hypothetical protein PISMIDRAFT_125761 [Pisolithus microcarpus 441]